MIVFLIKIFFYYVSSSLIFLAEKVVEAVNVQNNGSWILFLDVQRKIINPLIPGGNKKITHTCYHQALKG